MESELRFAAGLVVPVAIGAFVAVSLALIIWSARRRPAGPRAGVFAGLIPGLTAGVLVFVPVLLLYVIFESLSPPGDRWRGFGLEVLQAFVFIVGPITLAVLDLYAIAPPIQQSLPAAVGRAVLGVILIISLTAVFSGITTTLDSAAHEEYLAAQQRALEARSAGLSMEVVVVDTVLGDVTDKGRAVSHLTLDITVRSATTIQLLPLTEPDLVNQVVVIGPVDAPIHMASFHIEGLGLPTHIRAGLDETYRVSAVLFTAVNPEYFTTGPWRARLDLTGLYDQEGYPITYETTTAFTVSGDP